MFTASVFSPDILIFIGIAVVVLFGGAAIPKLARNLGSAKSEFEKGIKTAKTDEAAAPDETKTADTP